MSGKLEKMTIEGYKEATYIGFPKLAYRVMFNPTTYSENFVIKYNDSQAIGDVNPKRTLEGIKPREFSFEFLFDGTGTSAEKTNVSEEIDAFLSVCGKVGEDLSELLYLKLSWGDLLLKCVLKSADISYTLFKPDGTPLRAKVSCKFLEHSADIKSLILSKLGINDLSEFVEITDKVKYLSNLAHSVYDDPSLYLEVAAANELTAIRQPLEGLNLNLPPLK